MRQLFSSSGSKIEGGLDEGNVLETTMMIEKMTVEMTEIKSIENAELPWYPSYSNFQSYSHNDSTPLFQRLDYLAEEEDFNNRKILLFCITNFLKAFSLGGPQISRALFWETIWLNK